jgi:hypothetical protein
MQVGCLVGFFVRLARMGILLLPGVREQIVHGLFTVDFNGVGPYSIPGATALAKVAA